MMREGDDEAEREVGYPHRKVKLDNGVRIGKGEIPLLWKKKSHFESSKIQNFFCSFSKDIGPLVLE